VSDRRIPDEGTIFQILGMQKQEWKLLADLVRETELLPTDVATATAVKKFLQRVEGMR
jgi:chromatin segregation and condensation protein Rec8/ScpA/Scc1 (kleisin family)